ncbi:MAG: glycosidase [Verrucomicrobiales bacterium]|jgi:glycosidase
MVSQESMERIRKRFVRLYGERAPELIERLHMMIGRYGVGIDVAPLNERWTEKDTLLITYADMVQHEGERPVVTLKRFLEKRLHGAFRTVHILPFSPWSSDDGFSVIDYRAVNPNYGEWGDVESLSQSFQLMFDLVLNHCSSQSGWFRDFINGTEPGSGYFIKGDPEADLSEVVRPRPWPLLTKVTTHEGDRHVWTTFSEDQVDLNWENPNVLFEFIDILLFYISKGMRIIRLDAVAYLWKKLGTSCIHLEETHEIVKLLRDIVDMVAPQTIIISETNVPHAENISYLGQRDEAHMVYQFSLPPLLLYSLLRGNCQELRAWALSLPPLAEDTTFLNFTASHDGIGMRPLQGLISDADLSWLVQEITARHGLVSTRRMADGSESPYELNITYASALSDPNDVLLGRQRFLCSQAVAMSMQGIPAIYFHSLMGAPNDLHGVQEKGHSRAINRKKWDELELRTLLNESDGEASIIFESMVGLLRRRADYPAFHPDAGQEILDLGDAVFALIRVAKDTSQRIVCLFNMSREDQMIPKDVVLSQLHWEADTHTKLRDLTTGLFVDHESKSLALAPYQYLWLVTE